MIIPLNIINSTLLLENICYFCRMSDTHVVIITSSADLPMMTEKNFFHSSALFRIAEKTPGQKPVMAILMDGQERLTGHLLAIITLHGSVFPPLLYSHGRIYGTGEYTDGIDKEQAFSLLLTAITKQLSHKMCLYIEFSDISTKMFGYRHFRHNGYFPIQWQEVHNSLHSMAPEKRISAKAEERIHRAYQHGASAKEAETVEEIDAFHRLLRNYFRLKHRRSVPAKEMFHLLAEDNHSKTFITKYKGNVIGGCVCLYSENNAYLWYLASKKKTYHLLHPDAVTIWQAIKYAHDKGYDHIYFMDAGLPLKKSPFREFILQFGGKPVSKYRWFRCPFPWINKLCSWLFNE